MTKKQLILNALTRKDEIIDDLIAQMGEHPDDIAVELLEEEVENNGLVVWYMKDKYGSDVEFYDYRGVVVAISSSGVLKAYRTLGEAKKDVEKMGL